jgi:O-methyltransferase involved in polyketide biosynthesis
MTFYLFKFLIVHILVLGGAFAGAFSEPHIPSPQSIGKIENAESRGSNYGAQNNATIPTARDAAMKVGVKPPIEASAAMWKRAWNLHRTLIPVLHVFDRLKPPDSSLSLMILWLKALSANDKESPAFDDSLTYDLLPPVTRCLVSKRLRRFFPRLHHANVEIRTAFLDQSVAAVVNQVRLVSPPKKIRLISLGGGYDPRSIKFRERGIVDAAIELDLPKVVSAKQKIFTSKRFRRRRPSLRNDSIPTFHSVDLNDLDAVETTLWDILISDPENSWHTIFLFEAVMIYLNEGAPNSLLALCSRVLQESGCSGTLCFADRLERIPGGDKDMAVTVLAQTGWRLITWSPKPGLARHMGVAEPIHDAKKQN